MEKGREALYLYSYRLNKKPIQDMGEAVVYTKTYDTSGGFGANLLKRKVQKPDP